MLVYTEWIAVVGLTVNKTKDCMKKLIVLAIIGFAAWYYHEHHGFDFLENLDLNDFKITNKYNSENKF